MTARARSFFDASSPVAWLFTITTAVGALFTIPFMLHSTGDGGEYSLLLVSFALFSVFPVFLVFRWMSGFIEQSHSLLVAALAWGLFAASTHAREVSSGLSTAVAAVVDADWVSAVVAPLVEEPAKLTGVALLLYGARHRVHGLFDGIALGAFVGLGFAIAEDFAYHLHWLHDGGGDVTAGVDVIALRSLNILAGGHINYTAVAGAGLAYLLTAREHGLARRFLVAAVMLVAGLALHTFWNSPLLVEELPGAAFVLRGIPGILAMTAVAAWAGRREERHLAAVARTLPAGTILPTEIPGLVHPFARIRGALSRALLPAYAAEQAVLVRNAQLAAARAKRLDYPAEITDARVRAVRAARRAQHAAPGG